MLILLRKPGQAIVIDGGIRVTVLSVEGDRVCLGVEAPSDLRVLRHELLAEIGAENRNALSAAGFRDDLRSRLLGQ